MGRWERTRRRGKEQRRGRTNSEQWLVISGQWSVVSKRPKKSRRVFPGGLAARKRGTRSIHDRINPTMNRRRLALLLLIALLAYLATGIYQVSPGELAVVRRFGQALPEPRG